MNSARSSKPSRDTPTRSHSTLKRSRIERPKETANSDVTLAVSELSLGDVRRRLKWRSSRKRSKVCAIPSTTASAGSWKSFRWSARPGEEWLDFDDLRLN